MPPLVQDRRRQAWILALLVALALGMRLASVDRLLPQFREPDAFEVYEMQRVQGDPALVKNVNFRERYPWLLAWTLAAVVPAARPPADASPADAEELHLAAAARPFLVVRTAVLLLATLQVLLTFFLARRFLPPGPALVAVFLVATSLLQLLFSVEARPHGFHAGLALLALVAALRLSERFGWGRLAAAVLASSAAIGSLQLGLSTLPPLALACLLARERSLLSRASLAVLAPLAALALALPWYTNRPYIDATGVHLASQQGGGHTLFFQWMDFLGSWRGALMLFEHDPVLALLAGAGLVLGLARLVPYWRASDSRARRALAVAAAFALPYTLVITIQGEVYERFLIPLLPFLACFAALVLAHAWNRGRVARAMVIAVLLLPVLSAGQFVRLARLPDAFEQAAAWLREHAQAGEMIVLFPDNSLPLLYAPEAVRAQLPDPGAGNLPWVTYQATIPALPEGTRTWNVHCFPARMALPKFGPDVERMRLWLAEEKVDYLVVEHSQRMWRKPILPSLERAASEAGTLVFRTTGAPPGLIVQGWMEYQAIEDFAWRQARQGTLGPPLRIWKLRR